MLNQTKAFASFSTDDIGKARKFYGDTLGIRVKEIPEGLELHLAGGGIPVFVYPSDDYHAPEHTVLNFLVDDIDEAIDDLGQTRRKDGALRSPGHEDRCQGDFPRRRQDGPEGHRLVQGPRRPHPLPHSGEVAPERLQSRSLALKQSASREAGHEQEELQAGHRRGFRSAGCGKSNPGHDRGGFRSHGPRLALPYSRSGARRSRSRRCRSARHGFPRLQLHHSAQGRRHSLSRTRWEHLRG